MNPHDPWSDIAANVPTGQLHARRVDALHPIDFYWAIDARGHRMLRYSARDLDVTLPLPSLQGIQIELSESALDLRLVQGADLAIFTTLCCSLIETTRRIDEKRAVIDRVLSHLERWQRFMGRAYRGLLTDQEVRGLFCELVFLDAELISRFGEGAIRYWRGPAGEPQDFCVGTTLFEVKSHLAGAAPIFMISSAEQLWHSSGNLYVTGYSIGESMQADAMSLNELVCRIRGKLTRADLQNGFEDSLVSVGYVDHPEYFSPKFSTSLPDYYEVRDNFPKITSDDITPGICRLKYGIEIPACLQYKTMINWSELGAKIGN